MLHSKITIPRLETHLHHSCNLKCDNCNHFSNYSIKADAITTDLYDKENRPWSARIFPLVYQLCGGEPTLNSDLVEICYVARDIWADSKILLVSNGFFLHKHPELPRALQENNIKLVVSVHDNSEKYNQKLDEVKTLLSSWLNEFKFELHYRESYMSWLKTFKVNENNNTVPCNDGFPKMSYDNCLSKTAKQLFGGRIYKCPPLAYLNLIKNKYDLGEEWSYYLGYVPLGPDCTHSELKKFMSIQEESYCNMCAANPIKYKKPDPLVQLRVNF